MYSLRVSLIGKPQTLRVFLFSCVLVNKIQGYFFESSTWKSFTIAPLTLPFLAKWGAPLLVLFFIYDMAASIDIGLNLRFTSGAMGGIGISVESTAVVPLPKVVRKLALRDSQGSEIDLGPKASRLLMSRSIRVSFRYM